MRFSNSSFGFTVSDSVNAVPVNFAPNKYSLKRDRNKKDFIYIIVFNFLWVLNTEQLHLHFISIYTGFKWHLILVKALKLRGVLSVSSLAYL